MTGFATGTNVPLTADLRASVFECHRRVWIFDVQAELFRSEGPSTMKRRDFLKTGIAGVASCAASPSGVRAVVQEEILRVGLIGAGWYGKTDLFHLIQVAPVEVVALCDVDRRMVDEAADLVARRQTSKQRPQTYGDYRKLLSEQSPDIVLIGTPDHWHCLPMVEACKAGADVYVQKPISWDVVEGQAMVAAARKYKRTVQVGLQRRSTPHLLEARDDSSQSGKLGKIAFVDIHSYYGGPRDFPPTQPPPDYLDWETYVGPATWRDYNPGIHPRSWRACREFSNGQTGDLCVHFFDVVRYFLEFGWPRSISASGGILMRSPDSNINTHDTQTALFDFGDVQVVWNQRNWGQNPDPDYPWGATFYGDKGTLKLSIRGYDFIPRETDRRSTVTRLTNANATRRTSSTKPPNCLPPRPPDATCRISWRHGAKENCRWPISNRATSPRPVASSPTCRWNLAAPCNGTARQVKWSGMTRPTADWRESTAPRGCIRRRRACRQSRQMASRESVLPPVWRGVRKSRVA